MIVVRFIDASGKSKNLMTAGSSLIAKEAIEKDYGQTIQPDRFYVDDDYNIVFDPPGGGKYVIENLIHWS